MLKSIGSTLFAGFMAIVPAVLTIYLLYWMAITSEQVMGGALKAVLPDIVYFPGMGSLAGVLIIFIVGLLLKAFFVQQLFQLGETLLYRIPLIKTIYGLMRDLFDFFSPSKKEMGRVVTLDFNGVKVVGFVTQENLTDIPLDEDPQGKVLVYIPMSYMIGGFTVMVPREQLTPCDIKVDEAMRFVLTAGITTTGMTSHAPAKKQPQQQSSL